MYWFITLTWKVKCLKSLIFCFLLFSSSSRNRVCVRFHDLYIAVCRIYVRNSRLMPCLWYIFRLLAHILTCTHAHNSELQGWHIQSSFKMAAFGWMVKIYFTQFRWIFKELCRVLKCSLRYLQLETIKIVKIWNFELGRDAELTHLRHWQMSVFVKPFTDRTLPLRSKIVWRYTV